MKSKKKKKPSATKSQSSRKVNIAKIEIAPDEKRHSTMYARIKKGNKAYIEQCAKKDGVSSVSLWLDRLIDQLREKKII